jgi:hypothetical protein
MVIRGFDGEAYDARIRELAEARAEIERLQKLVDRLTADYAKIHSCVQAYLDAPGQIRGEAFRDLAGTMEHLSGRDDAQGWAACYRRSEAEIERLQAIIEHCRRYAPSVVAAAEGQRMQQDQGVTR